MWKVRERAPRGQEEAGVSKVEEMKMQREVGWAQEGPGWAQEE